MGFDCSAFRVRIIVDTEYIEDMVILVPEQFLDIQQVRELQTLFDEKDVVVLPPGRILKR